MASSWTICNLLLGFVSLPMLILGAQHQRQKSAPPIFVRPLRGEVSEQAGICAPYSSLTRFFNSPAASSIPPSAAGQTIKGGPSAISSAAAPSHLPKNQDVQRLQQRSKWQPRRRGLGRRACPLGMRLHLHRRRVKRIPCRAVNRLQDLCSATQAATLPAVG